MNPQQVLDTPRAVLTVLAPSSDAKPVEKAVTRGIAEEFGPETFLRLTFHRPDGSARAWYAWTAGGEILGDQIDALALAGGLDAADWMSVAEHHERESERGRIVINAYPLRPVLAEITTGVVDVESTQKIRWGLRRMLARASDLAGRDTPPLPQIAVPRWLGFGPQLVTRSARSCGN